MWYAATLQSSNIKIKEADRFIIYRYEDEDYIQISNISITRGSKISSYASHGLVYIVIAENSKSRAIVYLFDIEEKLNKIQTIDALNPSDIEIWELNNVIYLAFTQEMLVTENGTYFETESPVFKWVGKNFEYVQNINTIGARKITSFSIGDDQFLAVANHRNNKGESEVFSEIFKYNEPEEKFISYQQILTYAAVDIQYFCFKHHNLHESFIVVANSYGLDYEGNMNHETSSIVYKYVENYFMPFQSFILNYAEQWLPVAGPNGEFILLVSMKNDGVKVFQYDGWRFVESEVQYTGEAFGSGIRSFRSYLYNNLPLIAVANKYDHGNMLNVFSPSFNYQNVMNEFQMDMYEWCQQITNEIDKEDLNELNERIEEAPKVGDIEIELNGKLYFQDVTIDNLVIKDENVNTRVKKSNEVLYLEKEINNRSKQLEKMDTKLRNNYEPIVLNGNVRVKRLDVSHDDRIIFEDLQTTSINNIKLEDFFNDIINIDEPFTINDNMEFEDIIFDDIISPDFINNIPKEALLYSTSNLTNLDLIVQGNVIIEDLIVNGYFDEIYITENNILLTEGDQTLTGNIMFSGIETENMDVKYINNIDMINLDDNRIVNITEHSVESLTVKNVTVHMLNGMVMDSFHKLALRSRGDQEIFSYYEFDSLTVDEFEVDGLLSDTNISTLALISDSTNLILQPLFFSQDLEIKHFHVINTLNKIPVYNGKLDVLLTDKPGVQYVTADKTFESINLSGPIQLRGRIKIKGLEPPIIKKNLTLFGDYTINGETIVKNLFMFKDLTEPSETYSMERLETQGLKLIDTEIPNHLSFTQGLNVDEIEVETINEIDTASWIVFESDSHEISGTKIYNNDLKINGKLTVHAINGQNLEKLYDNILRIDSDQIITGKHSYSIVSAIRVVSNKTLINNIPWANVVTLNTDQYINGTTTLTEPVQMSEFEANRAELKGKIRNHNFDELIADTAFNDTENIVTGKKIFEKNVVFKKLNADFINNASLHKLLIEINKWIGDVHMYQSINMNKLHVDNLFFNDINGINSEDFGNIWLLKEGDQTIYEGQTFETVVCKQNLIINSGLINDIDLIEIDNAAVKTNEKHIFKSIEFVNGVESEKTIIVGGHVNNVDINDAVLRKSSKPQTIYGTKTISKNFTVDGILHVHGLLSGINITLLHRLTNTINDRKEMNVVIDGNINFKQEFNVKHLNQFDIEKIAQNAWFTDQDTDIKGFISFENILFEDDLQVDGLVNDVSLVWLSKNYFSKTKDQTISARLDFVDGVLFAKDLEAEKAIVTGLVSNISIQKFNQHILRNDEQIFNYKIKFDDVEITNEFDAKLINNMNLSTDVMRNDVTENIVTGKKIISNMNATNLDIPKGKKIQNIDFDDWIRNAVLLNGTFKIDGLKTIKNAKFEKNIELKGWLNSHKFSEESIMTTHTKQNITGKKNFITSGHLINSSLTFDILKLKGLYNDIDIDKLMQEQIDKSKDVVTISATKNFYNTLSAPNVNFEQLYQGINMKELIKNITSLEEVDNYAEEYERLIDFTRNNLAVLKERSHILDTYEQIQKLNIGARDFIPLQEGEKSLMGLVSSYTSTIFVFSWDGITNQFIENNKYPIQTHKDIAFMSPIKLNNKNYVYLEEESDSNEGYTHLGKMYETSDTESDTNLYTPTNKTNSVISIKLPGENKNCLFNIHDTYANIYCLNDKDLFDLYQQINIINGIQVSIIYVDNLPYICIINLESNLIDSTMQIWKYDVNTLNFKLNQIYSISEASSIDTIYHQNNYFIALGVKHNMVTGKLGSVVIYKYDATTDKFEEWQIINIVDPTAIKFGILSSNELVLHILSKCPAEPLNVYVYEGISGFTKKFITCAIPVVNIVSHMQIDDIDFIFVSNNKEIRIFKALYYGKIYK